MAGEVGQKRGGSVGIAYESAPGTPETTPVYYIPSDDANIMTDPMTYERTNNLSAENIGMQQAGYDPSFSFSDSELPVEIIGYLLWLFFGAEDNSTPGTHVITPQFDSKYFTFFKDHGVLFDGTNRTERLVEARFDTLSIDQQAKSYAKIAGSGIGLSTLPMVAALSPTVDLTTEGAPLSWNALRTGAFSLNWNGSGLSATTAIKSLKIDLNREVDRAGADLASDQGSEVVQGGRTVMFEMTLDLKDSGADLQAAYSAMKAGEPVGFQAIWVIGTSTLTIAAPEGIIEDNVPGSLGAGAEPQEWTISAKAYQIDGEEVFDAIALDGNTDDYDAR